jgi:hypothetical protein
MIDEHRIGNVFVVGSENLVLISGRERRAVPLPPESEIQLVDFDAEGQDVMRFGRIEGTLGSFDGKPALEVVKYLQFAGYPHHLTDRERAVGFKIVEEVWTTGEHWNMAVRCLGPSDRIKKVFSSSVPGKYDAIAYRLERLEPGNQPRWLENFRFEWDDPELAVQQGLAEIAK